MSKSKKSTASITKLDQGNVGRYEDSAEDLLLNFFTLNSGASIDKQVEFLYQNYSWPLEYHLSPQRQSLLEHYSFKKNSTVLEVGAGCGALTGLLCRKAKKVFANELMPKRAKIIQKRHAYCKNLDILQGNLFSIPKSKKFDYIVVIGVLEYAAKFYSGEKVKDPFLSFLTFLKGHLNSEGKIIIAIENKLGYKYIAGAPEDHLGTLFTSIENYPNADDVKTFSKVEITTLLNTAGFSSQHFMYPFPDYKLPSIIFSGDGLSSEYINFSASSFCQLTDQQGLNRYLFNETAFVSELLKNNVFSTFANSLLIEAST